MTRLGWVAFNIDFDKNNACLPAVFTHKKPNAGERTRKNQGVLINRPRFSIREGYVDISVIWIPRRSGRGTTGLANLKNLKDGRRRLFGERWSGGFFAGLDS